MSRLEKLVHGALIVALLVVLALIAAPAMAAEVEITLDWWAPIDGGPVAGYAVACTGDIPVDQSTAQTSLTASGEFDSGTVAGNCEVRAFNAAGFGPAAAASYSLTLDVTLPPGAPTNFTISFECSVLDGVVSCEQV